MRFWDLKSRNIFLKIWRNFWITAKIETNFKHRYLWNYFNYKDEWPLIGNVSVCPFQWGVTRHCSLNAFKVLAMFLKLMILKFVKFNWEEFICLKNNLDLSTQACQNDVDGCHLVITTNSKQLNTSCDCKLIFFCCIVLNCKNSGKIFYPTLHRYNSRLNEWIFKIPTPQKLYIISQLLYQISRL